MHQVCDLRKISESAREKSERDIQNGDDIDRTNGDSFSSREKLEKSFLAFLDLFDSTHYAF